jgi:hypothetical protein
MTGLENDSSAVAPSFSVQPTPSFFSQKKKKKPTPSFSIFVTDFWLHGRESESRDDDGHAHARRRKKKHDDRTRSVMRRAARVYVHHC